MQSLEDKIAAAKLNARDLHLRWLNSSWAMGPMYRKRLDAALAEVARLKAQQEAY